MKILFVFGGKGNAFFYMHQIFCKKNALFHPPRTIFMHFLPLQYISMKVQQRKKVCFLIFLFLHLNNVSKNGGVELRIQTCKKMFYF